MTNEDAVETLFQLRRQGFAVRRSPEGNVQVSPPGRLTEEIRETIRKGKAAILGALDKECIPGAVEAERKARELLSGKDKAWVAATVTEGGWVFVAYLRRDGSGFTVRIPRNKFDPVLLNEVLARSDRVGAEHET